MEHAINGSLEVTELDAYNALYLLLRYEADLDAVWTNRLGQQLSAALLLDNAWDHYVVPRSAEEEFADHSYLHLVELLLAYNRRLDAEAKRDPNDLKLRLLAVELEREEYGGYEASEALCHYVDSLGVLMAEPDVTWTSEEEARVRAWLRDVEAVRLAGIDDVPVRHLTHLVRGLVRIEENAGRK